MNYLGFLLVMFSFFFFLELFTDFFVFFAVKILSNCLKCVVVIVVVVVVAFLIYSFCLYHYFIRDIRQPLPQIRLSVSMSLGAGQIIFLAGINATENKVSGLSFYP